MDRFPVVHKQLLCLFIDPAAHKLSGWTEVQISCARGETTVGLHACNLDVRAVSVDNHPASFKLNPRTVNSLPASIAQATLKSSKQIAEQVADFSRLQYERLLQREEEPQLLIILPHQIQPKDAMDPMVEATLRIDYEVSTSGRGIHFHGHYAYTDSEVRRARAWFPCVDTPASAHPFELRLTVAEHLTALGPGELHKVTEALDRRKTFHYRLPLDTPPCHIGLAVGPFMILPGVPRHKGAPQVYSTGSAKELPGEDAMVTHCGPIEDQAALENTVQYLPLAFGLFESLLGAKFPYKAMQQAFLPVGAGPLQPISAAALQLLPSTLLFTDRCVEHAIESRLAIVRALTQQWFGIFMRPKAPADAWLLMGLAGWLEDQFVKLYMGKNEQVFRRSKEREAIYLSDNGQAPPLYPRGGTYPWGTMHGTEALDPSSLRQWKSAAVIGMLEKRVGEEAFRKLIERMVSSACHTSAQDVTRRLLGTRDFLKEVGRQGGFRKDITAFHERWIAGQGCPHITAAFTFHKKRNILEVALRQSGNEAAKKSLERAAAAAAASKDGSGIGIVEIQVRQDRSNPASTTEKPANLGTSPVTLVEIKLSTKQQMKRLKRKRRGAVADEDDSAEEEAQDEADPLNSAPISWVRVDPNAELLAPVQVLQPLSMWTAQLDHSREVVAQSAAVAGLAAERPFSFKALNALYGCLDNPKIYCRVRMEAAMALGATAHLLEDRPAMDKLIRFYTERCYDKDTRRPKQHYFDSLAEQFVNQAVLMALGMIRDQQGQTPPEILDQFYEILEHNDNNINQYSDSNFLVIVFTACSMLRSSSEQVMLGLLRQAEQYLARDEIMPSRHSMVSTAILDALGSLASQHKSSKFSARVAGILQRYQGTEVPFLLRMSALLPLERLKAAGNPLVEALAATDSTAHPAFRAALLEDCWKQAKQQPCDAFLPASAAEALALLERLHSLLGSDSPKLCHLAFMLLQRLAGRAPSLFEEPTEEQLPTGPTMSMETMVRRTVRPEPSGAGSMGSGGRAASGIKVKLKGTTSMAPAASQGGMPSPSNITAPQRSAGGTQPPSPTSRSPVPALTVPQPLSAALEAPAEVKAEPGPAFGGFPQAKAMAEPLSPRFASVPYSDQARGQKQRSHKRRKTDSEAPAQDLGGQPLNSAAPSAMPASPSPVPDEKTKLLQDVMAIMSAPSQAKPKSVRHKNHPPKTATPSPARPETVPLALPRDAVGVPKTKLAEEDKAKAQTVGALQQPSKGELEATRMDAVAIAAVQPAEGKPPKAQKQRKSTAPTGQEDRKSKQAPTTWKPRGASGRPQAPAADVHAVPPPAPAQAAPAAAASGPPAVLPAANQQAGGSGKKSGLSVKLSLGGKSRAKPEPSMTQQAAAATEEPLSFFGQKASPAPDIIPSKPPLAAPEPKGMKKGAAAGPKAKKKPAQKAAPAIAAAPLAQTGAQVPRPAAPMPKLSIKPPRPSPPPSQPQDGSSARCAQPTSNPLRLKIKLGGKAQSAAAPSPSPAASTSMAQSAQPVSIPSTQHVLPALPQASGQAESEAGRLPRPASETPEQRAERKLLEKLAKEEQKMKETEQERTARRAAKKDKKEAKKARESQGLSHVG